MSKEVLSKLGRRMRKLRQDQGISQERLAEMAELHRTYIGGIERGERNISFINLVAVAKALNVTLSVLVENIDGRKEIDLSIDRN